MTPYQKQRTIKTDIQFQLPKVTGSPKRHEDFLANSVLSGSSSGGGSGGGSSSNHQQQQQPSHYKRQASCPHITPQ